LLDVAIGWHTSHPLVASVIAGATRPDQIEANVAAAATVVTEQDRAEITALVST
jgi:aryl-alcohol dehydrogenase-like predicted oxidoreductase